MSTEAQVSDRAIVARGWQARKSAATRRQILAAAIRCFGERGYAQVSTARIAAQAGLSRGALLHHFPTQPDIVRGVVAAIAEDRRAALRAALEPPAADACARIRALLEVYWRELGGVSFAALFELMVAARGDVELRAIVDPAAAAFDLEWARAAVAVSPERDQRDESLDVELELARYALEGMAVAALTGTRDGRDPRRLRHLEERLCRRLADPSA